jgi:hypothetical protein
MHQFHANKTIKKIINHHIEHHHQKSIKYQCRIQIPSEHLSIRVSKHQSIIASEYQSINTNINES